MREYIVTCTMPREGRIYSDTFSRDDYFSPDDMRRSVMQYCKNAVELGWDVQAIDGDSRIIFIEDQLAREHALQN